MKDWLKKYGINILIAGAIAIPISLYGISQQRQPVFNTDTEVIEADTELESETQTTETGSEVTIEPMDSVTVTEPEEVPMFYDVPLSEELQLHIMAECDKHNIAPEIVIAMIEFESRYQADIIGDGGESFGLMQIQPKWHQWRMDKLGCTNLLDPFQNVTVGIDILAFLIGENADLYWVLMAYNAGPDKATAWLNAGTYTNYATGVVARATELERGVHNEP